MSSRSSSEGAARRLPIGRVSGHRGNTGELTVRVAAGRASSWDGIERVWIGTGDDGEERVVEHARGYKDRLVLKLRGIDGADAAAALRGRTVEAPEDVAPELDEGEYYVSRLVGLRVDDVSGRRIGVVKDLLPTGGVDLLVVAGEGTDLMIPMAREILQLVDESAGRIVVRLPAGLEDLNRGEDEGRS